MIETTRHPFSLPTLILMLFLCRESFSQKQETTCDSGEHRCWYIEQVSVRTTTYGRPWWCLFLCRVEYTIYRSKQQQNCKCCPGWSMQGGNCTQCETGQWGMNCRETCSCSVGHLCNPTDGYCQLDHRNCTGGSEPARCSEQRDCNGACVNGQRCNHTTDVCQCPPGWRNYALGESCNFFAGCSDGFFGMECDQPCQCQNNVTCNVLTGSCDCPAGWSGLTCGDPCGPTRYGRNCTKTCQCPEIALECSPIDGSCLCPAGFYGINCSTECPDGYYGSNCRDDCSCDVETETCDRTNGTCNIKKTGLPTPTLGSDPDAPGGQGVSVTGPVIGGVTAGILLCVMLVSLLIRRGRKRKQVNKCRTGNNLHTSSDVHFENGKAASEEYPEVEETRGISYAMSHQFPPKHFNVGGATYAISNQHRPDASDKFAEEEYEYCHLDRGVLKPTQTVPDQFNDHYNVLGATAADSDNQRDQYSRLDRGQRSESAPSNEDYGVVLKSGEKGVQYGRRSPDRGNKYEVVDVDRKQ